MYGETQAVNGWFGKSGGYGAKVNVLIRGRSGGAQVDACNPSREARLSRQKSAEAIVPSKPAAYREGPNIK